MILRNQLSIFLNNIFSDSSGIADHSPESEDGGCIHIKKLKYPVEETASMSTSFGCGICNELLATDFLLQRNL